MIRLEYVAHVDEERCTGCSLCERVCPAGAITMARKIAAVDADRCIDCQRCIDRCARENAVRRVLRPVEVIRFVDDSDVDQAMLKAFCRKAGLLPDLPVCGCTRTTGRETVAAILKGAKTPEDLCAMTGLRAGCGIYCMTRICQILEACGIEVQEPADRRWIKLTLSIGDIPKEAVARIDKAYPSCFVGEDWKRVTQRQSPAAQKEGAHD